MFKKTAVALILFLASLAACFGQGGRVPTTGSNNVWTGNNSFLYHSFVLNQGNSCGGGQAMVGYQSDFTPICAAFAGGVGTVNGLTGNVIITNGDSNLSVSESGNNIEIFCPGCSSGGGGNPGGSPGAVQYQLDSTHFGGVNITGLVFAQGSSAPRQAVAGTDYQTPISLSCPNPGITCPFAGSTYTITLTGSAGTGDVAAGINGQLGGYLGAGTTISGYPNLYALNPNWNVNQMTGLFSRFNGAVITSYSITSDVVTFQSVNAYNAGDVAVLFNFPTSTFFNNNYVTVLSTGLSNTQFEVAFTHANASATETGIASFNVPQQTPTTQGTIVIPNGIPINYAASAFGTGVNWEGSQANAIDTRKAAWNQQASSYGVVCSPPNNELYLTFAQGDTQVNVGASFASAAEVTGMTMVVGQQVSFGNTGTQNVWTPTVTGYTFPYLTLSSAAPFAYTGYVQFGVNNQAALQRAINDVGGNIPLWLPACGMLTDTLRWNGASLLGMAFSGTYLGGFPGHDVLQQQTAVPIVGWSINASTGVTTFTTTPAAAHTILPASLYPVTSGVGGDEIVLSYFPISTFFNGSTVEIMTQPTPTTFTVNSAFGQSTSSGTERGAGLPTTSAGVNGLRVSNLAISASDSIDPSYAWNSYDANATLTVEPPYARPLLGQSEQMNNPLAPGWGSGTVNGVSTIAQNSAVVCTSTTAIGGYTPRVPAVGSTIVFPYQTGGLVSRTVSSTAGSCASGYTPVTLSSALPNTSGYTGTQQEWFTYTTPQTLAVAMPGTVSLPYTITLAVPFPPIPGYESNVSSHGRVEIGNQEWDYTGVSFGGTAGGVPEITLRNGPTTVNGGSGWSVGSVVFPVNPCQATYTSPWPVVPTTNSVGISSWVISSNVITAQAVNSFVAGQIGTFLNQQGYPSLTGTILSSGLSGTQFEVALTAANSSGSLGTYTSFDGGPTPAGATYYGGICGGDAGISFPSVDGRYTAFNGSGLSLAHLDNIDLQDSTGNALGNQNGNGVLGIYEQGNNTGYGNTFDNLRGDGVEGGFMQGPASFNQYGVAAVGPTSTGQSINNSTWRTGYSISTIEMQQSKINRLDSYSSSTSQYDGTVNGASMDLSFLGTLNEETGGGVTGCGQFTVEDYNGEPENGNHEEFPPSVESDCSNATWSGTIFEGGFNIFGGSFQIIHGTQMAVPIFNYGSNNYFEHLYGVENTYNANNVYNGTSQFYNWGNFSTAQCQTGSFGPQQNCSPGTVQSYDGHDIWASMMGNNIHPSENVLGGMIVPGEWAYSGMAQVADPTELWWGQHSECPIGPANECISTQWDGFGGYIYVGPHKRIADTQYVLKANIKLKNSGTATFRLMFSVQDPGSGTCASPNYALDPVNFSVTSSGWTAIQAPVDFTGYPGCTMGVQIDSGSTTNVLEVGYFNFVPFPGQAYMPLGTPTLGAACPVAGEFQMDTGYMWLCRPASGHAFGAGTWGQVAITP
jgi:hypothetical protein